MNDLELKELRELEGLSKNAHKTLEQIVEQMRTTTYEPVEREPIELEYVPRNYPLD